MVNAVDILILGDHHVGKRTLQEQLPGARPCPDGNSATLTLDTKYYTADVSIALYGGSRLKSEELPLCQAVVLIFDCTREASFDFVKQYVKKDAVEAAEIRLCVASKVDNLFGGNLVKRPEWLLRASTWCTQELFEYIEVAATDLEVDRNLSRDGERQGLRRVLSALEAHIWPGLSMKDSQHPTKADKTPLAAQQVPQEQVNFSSDSEDHEDPAQLHSLDDHFPGKQQWLDTSGRLPSQAETSSSKVDEASEQSDELLENEIDKFERMMSEAMGARSRIEGLPDEDRRLAAEALTLKLLSNMGIEDEYSDSDED